jgi:hypothetical protein
MAVAGRLRTPCVKADGSKVCCCCPPPGSSGCIALPAPETLAVQDLIAATSHSGNVQSAEFPAWYLECFVPKCKILTGSKIDDFGTIGGVLFQNNVSCSPGPGRVTNVGADTEVAVTVVANKINVAWSATSDAACGPPTGLGATGAYCTFHFYWDYI